MAISSVSIVQDNFVNGSNLLPVHQPLAFLIDATYSGDTPDYITIEIYDKDDILLGTFKGIYYSDISSSIRRFVFFADEILKGFMGVFDDAPQSGGTIEFVEDITKQFTLDFEGEELEIVAIHAASQFGEHPNKESVYNNESKTYQGYNDSPCYVYFYNNDTSNIITVSETSIEDNATDSDDVDFTDSDEVLFTIQIAI